VTPQQTASARQAPAFPGHFPPARFGCSAGAAAPTRNTQPSSGPGEENPLRFQRALRIKQDRWERNPRVPPHLVPTLLFPGASNRRSLARGLGTLLSRSLPPRPAQRFQLCRLLGRGQRGPKLLLTYGPQPSGAWERAWPALRSPSAAPG